MTDSIYIYGASGHGLVVADIAKACGYKNIIFVDDGDNEYPSFIELRDKNSPICFGIGDNKTRKILYDKVLNNGFDVVSLIHPTAILSSNIYIGEGSVIMPNVVVNANTRIGKCVIINSSCVVEHENIIEDFVHISPNAALAGNVMVKENTHIGIGTVCIQNKTIGKDCIIGAGSVIVKDIPSSVKAFGNPCKVIEEL